MLKLHIQIAYGLLAVLLSSGFASGASAEVTRGPWVSDGTSVCIFGWEITKTRCTQYYQEIKHKEADGLIWSQFRYKWIGGHNIVIYLPVSGMLFGSDFTTGYLTTLDDGKVVYKREEAVSYSASRVEVIIGIPNEGYSFTATRP